MMCTVLNPWDGILLRCAYVVYRLARREEGEVRPRTTNKGSTGSRKDKPGFGVLGVADKRENDIIALSMGMQKKVINGPL